jgi:hypothetical protein
VERHLTHGNGLPSFVSQGRVDQGQAWLPFGTKVLFIPTLSIAQHGP